MYTSDPSGQFYSLKYESLMYFGRLVGGGEIISDRMSYRNHYMCSGEATSVYYGKIKTFIFVQLSSASELEVA